MRLVDADALRAQFREPDDYLKTEGVLWHITGIWAAIDATPTIEAIPVEWLRNLCAIAKMETDDEMFIDWLIQTWEKEQEAR